MIATHTIKINGVMYKAGTKLPARTNTDKTAKTITETKKKAYSKTEINRMNVADLRKYAAMLDIEAAESKSGTELKKIIIDKLGL